MVMNRLNDLAGSKKDLLALFFLFGLVTLFFANVLFTSKVLVGDDLARYSPWNYYADPETQAPINYEYDTLLAYYPQILIARQTLSSGSLPFWNPYYLSGLPSLAAAPWLGFFYPPHMLFYVVDPLQAFGYISFIELCLGGAFMYFYLKSIDCSRLAALVGSVSFGLGGFLLANLAWLPRVSAVIWTPLLFLCFENLLRQKGWMYALLGAFAIAMCILGGNMASTVYVMLALGLYSLFRLGLVLRNEGAKIALRYAGIFVVLAIMGILLSAAQLIPTYEVTGSVKRVQVSYEDRIEPGRPPLALGTIVVPDIFGNPVDRPWGRNAFAKNIPGTYGETSMYIGILPLFLVIWALIRRRDKYTIFFASLAILSILIFVDTPLFRLLYDFPLFRIGRQLEAKVMWAFAASVLVALGFTSLMESVESRDKVILRRASVALLTSAAVVILSQGLGWILLSSADGTQELGLPAQWFFYNISNFLRLAVLIFACAILLFLCAHGSTNANLLALLAIGIMVADLAYFGWKLNPARQPEVLYPHMDSVQFLQSDDNVYRTIRGPLSRKVFPPNSLAVYGIEDAQGYSPALLEYYVDFLNLIEENVSGPRKVHSLRYPASLSSRLLDLLNVKYVITIADPGEEMAQLERTDDNIGLLYDGEVKIYENKDVLPRAFVVTNYKVLQDKGEILAELASEEFDPAVYVVLEEEPESHSARTDTSGEGLSASILEYTPNRVTIEAEMSSDGFLVLSDLHYNGWKAFVDGEERKVYKADYIFRAVQLREGKHIVEFVFDPVSFKIGLSISALTLLVVIPLLAYILRRKACTST
jgi:hypothetical protein